MNNVQLTNFALAVQNVTNQIAGKNGMRVAEACGVREHFPRTDRQIFQRKLQAVIKAGLVRTLSDGDCLWIVAKAA